MLRLTEIKLPLDHDDGDLERAILARLGIRPEELLESCVVPPGGRRPQERGDPRRLYRRCGGKGRAAISRRRKPATIAPAPDLSYQPVARATGSSTSRRWWSAAGRPGFSPPCSWRARATARCCWSGASRSTSATATWSRFWSGGALAAESNLHFGEGGAGTFSDGKLTTLIHDPRCRKVLEEFVAAGAPAEILFLTKPHLGSDRLPAIVAQHPRNDHRPRRRGPVPFPRGRTC